MKHSFCRPKVRFILFYALESLQAWENMSSTNRTTNNSEIVFLALLVHENQLFANNAAGKWV